MTHPPTLYESSHQSASLSEPGIVRYLNLIHSNRRVVVSNCDFNVHFCNNWWSFHVLICHPRLFSGEMTIKKFAHFLLGFSIIDTLLYVWIFIHMGYQSFIKYSLQIFFSKSEAYLCVFFWRTEVKFWQRPIYLFVFCYRGYTGCCILRNLCLTQGHNDFLLCFLSGTFIILYLGPCLF